MYSWAGDGKLCVQAVLNTFGECFTIGGVFIKEDLRATDGRILVAVLMDADGQERLFPGNDGDATLHILCFFVGGVRIIESVLRFPGQNDMVACICKKLRQLFCIDEVQYFFRASAASGHARVIAAMSRIEDDRSFAVILRRLEEQITQTLEVIEK